MDQFSLEDRMRIIQEIVPGKQITLAHVIANPDKVLYKKLGLDPKIDYTKSAIGIVTMSPAETSIIAGDIALKAAGIEIGFIDRFSGTLIITGTISEVDAGLKALTEYCKETLNLQSAILQGHRYEKSNFNRTK